MKKSFGAIMVRSSLYTFVLFLLVACSPSNDATPETLADLVALHETFTGNVIACASGSDNPNEIIAYAYPRPGATALRYFETDGVDIDPMDFRNYKEISLDAEDLFNGYLMQFRRQVATERWVIITFMESGALHLSNPIRLKHISQNTEFTEMTTTNFSEPNMPMFTWSPSFMGEDAIYFQVVADSDNNLLSGTYTFDTTYQYYVLDNVVLNITLETPPALTMGTPYNFTLMGVSEDNWVNQLDRVVFTIP